MSDGIHIPAIAVRVVVLAVALALVRLAWSQAPEARRYLKMERM